MYCITTNTLCTKQITYVTVHWQTGFLSRSLVSCFEFLFILLARQLSSSTTMHCTFHQWTLHILEGERPYDSSRKKRSCETILVVSFSLFHIDFTA
jgi:hypothetical protein